MGWMRRSTSYVKISEVEHLVLDLFCTGSLVHLLSRFYSSLPSIFEAEYEGDEGDEDADSCADAVA